MGLLHILNFVNVVVVDVVALTQSFVKVVDLEELLTSTLSPQCWYGVTYLAETRGSDQRGNLMWPPSHMKMCMLPGGYQVSESEGDCPLKAWMRQSNSPGQVP